MKNKILIALFAILIISQSCNVIFDKDVTEEISSVSIKPTVELIGEPIMSLVVGGTYSESGVNAFSGDEPLDYSIVSGNVDSNSEGFYVVTYKAENKYGWATFAYRSVLVYAGSPYSEDITGHYKSGFLFDSDISKYTISGYWQMTNVWIEEGVTFPIIFADKGNGQYGIVPGEFETKGRYTGSALKTGNDIKFTMRLTSPDGIVNTKTFIWTKQ